MKAGKTWGQSFTAPEAGRALDRQPPSQQPRYIKEMIDMLPLQQRKATLLAALDLLNDDLAQLEGQERR